MNKNMELEDFGADPTLQDLDYDVMRKELAEYVELIKLSITDVTYYIIHSKQVVGCKMKFHIKGSDDALNIATVLWDGTSNEVTAEAHIAPGDVFDVEIGKKIARAKAESMAYKKAMNFLHRVAGRAMDVLSQYDDFMYKAESVIEHNNRYLATF